LLATADGADSPDGSSRTSFEFVSGRRYYVRVVASLSAAGDRAVGDYTLALSLEQHDQGTNDTLDTANDWTGYTAAGMITPGDADVFRFADNAQGLFNVLLTADLQATGFAPLVTLLDAN